ncbi:MAG: HVO_A0114 family putative DNA-binding protein [Steroidobacteraceae bacterium]
MKTMTLEVRSLRGALNEVASAVQSRRAMRTARISFASAELLWQVLTAKRWEILKAMTGAGALSIRAIARRVERDVKAVHADVHALLDAGVISKTPEGKMIFPYDAIHVDFVLKAVA